MHSQVTKVIEVVTRSGYLKFLYRECVSAGAAGAQTRRSLGHHLLHPLILRLIVLCAPADFETQSSPGCTCTRRSKFLTHSLIFFSFFEKQFNEIYERLNKKVDEQ